MAQYRQFGARDYDLHHNYNGGGGQDHVPQPARAASQPLKQGRHRRLSRSDKVRRVCIGAVTVILCLSLFITVSAYYCLIRDSKDVNDSHNQVDDLKNDTDFLTNVTRTEPTTVLGFGKGSVAHERDSRYWNKDDRRRDDDYNEDEVEHSRDSASNGSTTSKGLPSSQVKLGNKKSSADRLSRHVNQKGVGLYNEAGRNELKMYEAEYEASLKKSDLLNKESPNKNQLSDNEGVGSGNEAIDVGDEDDGIDSSDGQREELADDDDPLHDEENSDFARSHEKKSSFSESGRESSRILEISRNHQRKRGLNDEMSNRASKRLIEEDSFNSQSSDYLKKFTFGQVIKKPKVDPRRKSKHSSCEMKVLDSTAQLVEPLETRKFLRFALQYVEKEEKPHEQPEWEPRFAGHQSLQEREASFLARNQKINCGFVRGPEGSPSTGFDLTEDDANYISRCHIAVVSCIFGNSDLLRPPANKMMTRLSRKNVCFVMFVDEVTLQTLKSEGRMPDTMGFIDLWKIVVVKNLPYTDMRRVGKVPKFLTHRLFPSARYSIWLDSKLRLQLDPLLIAEYFLWRKGHEYAISNHYDRHCVWEEVAQNKKLNKYNHTAIDEQFKFYQSDGLRRFNPLDPQKLLRSNVPEGSFIVRAHTPMSNLFSCLWFNEVDRFTSRDQLSFAYTYQKLRKMNPSKPFHLNMFKDCERRHVAKLFHHRSEEEAKDTHQLVNE